MKFREFVDEQGIPLRKLAKRLGLSEGCIHNIYYGKSSPTAEVCDLIITYSKGRVTLKDLCLPKKSRKGLSDKPVAQSQDQTQVEPKPKEESS